MARTPLHWSAIGLDFVSLRVFKAAAEERSLAGAAEREQLALSAVSRRISYMEERLGAALLRRHDRGVEPTAAGEALLRHLGPLFDLTERAVTDVSAFASGGRGHVRLFANISSVTGSCLRRWLASCAIIPTSRSRSMNASPAISCMRSVRGLPISASSRRPSRHRTCSSPHGERTGWWR